MTSVALATPIAVLDDVRRRTFRAALSVPALRAILVDKDRRVAMHALVGVIVATLVAIAAPPRVALVASPLLLGVPHLASEVRWLAVRRRLPRPFLVVSLLFAIAVAAAAWLGWRGHAWLGRGEIVLGGAWIAASAALGTGRARSWLIALGGAALIAGGLVSAPFAGVVRDVAVGLHAFVSIAIWALAFRSRRRFAIPAIGMTLAGLTLVILLRGPLLAQAFLQSVHYAVWIALVPQDGVRTAGTPTFKMSAKGWWKDLGPLGCAAIASAAIGLVLLVVRVGPEVTRDGYLVVARFHVWFELAMGASLLARRERFGFR